NLQLWNETKEHTTNLVFRIIAGLPKKCKSFRDLQAKFIKIRLTVDVSDLSSKQYLPMILLDGRWLSAL
ncbi:MAG: hypothetical protein AAGC93_30195, partial [Cyanobacteria bacterium P01_F01_bin.53]